MARFPVSTTLSAAAALVAAAPAAPADEEALRKELEATKRSMEELRRRVEEIEKSGGMGAPGEGVVTAPNSRKIELSGQVLTWFERWDHAYRPNDPMGSDLQDQGWLRASIQADADIEENLSARIEIRDARIEGTEPATNAQTNSPGTGTDLKQGWFQVDDILKSATSMRAGRQVLAYGDHRLIGDQEWSTYGRSFDALLLTRPFARTNTRVDAFAGRVIERGAGTVTPGIDNDDQDLFGVYAVTPKALHHSDLDLYGLWLRDLLDAPGEQPGNSGNTGFLTAGARIAGVKGALDWAAEGAFQHGRLRGDSLSALAGHARAGWTLLDAKWKPRFGIEWDVATGDDDPADGESESFQTLFPSNHEHYGILDLVAWQNMHAYRAGVQFRPHEKVVVALDAWKFWLFDSDDAWYGVNGAVIRPGAAGSSSDLGTEFDLEVTWTISEHFEASFGAAHFADGEFVRDTGDAGDTNWIYFRFLVAF
ncbi:MAG TPA: alginate export family protein [Candidatus Eisenbacteria bacterium]|nr:alginate export family protein [Candidatus Eisenbacteria bacterium]